MRYSISDTAEYGDYTGGPRIVTEQTRETCAKYCVRSRTEPSPNNGLRKIQTGREWFEAAREKEQQQKIEKVGEELRAMMPFLDPVKVKQTSKRTKVPA